MIVSMPRSQVTGERNNGTRELSSPRDRGPASCQSGASSLHHYFERTVDAHPLSPALVCGREVYTYADLEARANQLAHHLRHLGVGPGDCVGLLLERSLHTYVSLLATLKCGATFVPLDTSFPAERLAFIADDADLRLLITSSSFEGAASDLPCVALFLDAALSVATEPSSRLKIVQQD